MHWFGVVLMMFTSVLAAGSVAEGSRLQALHKDTGGFQAAGVVLSIAAAVGWFMLGRMWD